LNLSKRDRLASEVDLRRAASQLQEHLDAQKVTPKVTPADFNAEKIKDN
jgi:hypothetical protein